MPVSAASTRWSRITALGMAAAALCMLSTCSPQLALLDQVRVLGVLRVATVNSPTTYYEGPAGPTGFEYELARGFAEKLGVGIEVVLTANANEALAMLDSGRAQLAAAGVVVTPLRTRRVRFTRPVLNVVPQLVRRAGAARPASLDQLSGTLVVGRSNAAIELLTDARSRYPDLSWTETDEFGTEELLQKVAQGEIDYTVAPSDLLAINQRYYPTLRVAFALTKVQDVAWALRRGRDNSLFAQAQQYLGGVSEPDFRQLRDRYFGHVEQVDVLGALALATHVETRLPSFRKLFEQNAEKFGIDWRLLAAIGYQESHWDPSAVSPTGVRGIMQLTAQTARFLRVNNREDPAQSIAGGARYIRQLIEKIPPDVPDPDRTWFALAAYNLGYGHLVDARALTAQRGGDPNRWVDLRKTLPLLTQARWHRQTRYGYARGHEAETYVGNVRTYYDMLVNLTGGVPKTPEAVEPPEPKTQAEEPLNIRTPIL
ncbi:MAG: membrane-bound lytic murein transglycosylase MltF [Panacagrimonas sp.]